jgi:hypothetical protein
MAKAGVRAISATEVRSWAASRHKSESWSGLRLGSGFGHWHHSQSWTMSFGWSWSWSRRTW